MRGLTISVLLSFLAGCYYQNYDGERPRSAVFEVLGEQGAVLGRHDPTRPAANHNYSLRGRFLAGTTTIFAATGEAVDTSNDVLGDGEQRLQWQNFRDFLFTGIGGATYLLRPRTPSGAFSRSPGFSGYELTDAVTGQVVLVVH